MIAWFKCVFGLERDAPGNALPQMETERKEWRPAVGGFGGVGRPAPNAPDLHERCKCTFLLVLARS